MKNENFYAREYSQFVGPVQNALQTACKNYNYSELLEIVALSTMLQCDIRSVYPNIDFRDDMMIVNRIFTPVPPTHANYQITILWSHVNREINARASNNGVWSPNHFVPLLSRPERSQESDHRNQSARAATVSFLCSEREWHSLSNHLDSREENTQKQCRHSSTNTRVSVFSEST